MESFKAGLGSGLRASTLREEELNAQLMIEVAPSTQALMIAKHPQTKSFVLEWPEFKPRYQSAAAQEGLQALEQYTVSDKSTVGSAAESEHVLRWFDTAHYFGTLPMTSTNGNQLSVNSDFGIREFPGIYCLGSSAFPTGGHSHPTLAAVMTAVQFSSLQ